MATSATQIATHSTTAIWLFGHTPQYRILITAVYIAPLQGSLLNFGALPAQLQPRSNNDSEELNQLPKIGTAYLIYYLLNILWGEVQLGNTIPIRYSCRRVYVILGKSQSLDHCKTSCCGKVSSTMRGKPMQLIIKGLSFS